MSKFVYVVSDEWKDGSRRPRCVFSDFDRAIEVARELEKGRSDKHLGCIVDEFELD